MSYSFSITAGSKDEAGKKVEEQLAQVVASQPIHEADRQAAQDTAEGMINCLADPGDGKEISVYVSGSLGWSGVYPDSHAVTSSNVSVTASVRDKATS